MFKRNYRIGIFAAALMFICCVALSIFISDAKLVKAEEEGADWVHYLGIATGKVNVRTGPGEEFDKLTGADGSNVQLSAQEEVTIIGEEKAKSGNVWYKISFFRDGVELTGYSTSTYLSKDETTVITPSPTPSPTPTPSPSPSPSPTPTEEAAPTQSLIPTDETPANDKNDILKTILTVLAVTAFAILVLIGVKIYRSVTKKSGGSMSKRVEKIKSAQVEGKQGGRKRPEIKRFDDEEPLEQEVREDVYVKDYQFSNRDGDSLSADASREAEEKRELRAAIDRLQEHDIIIHQYFGEGEVYDNSDVKLLEVRFGSDVRFLNKESLVSKRLIEILDEDQSTSKRRNRKRTNR